jgi:hypothetical protein
MTSTITLANAKRFQGIGALFGARMRLSVLLVS